MTNQRMWTDYEASDIPDHDVRSLSAYYNTPRARNLRLVFSRIPSSLTIRRAACGVTSSVFAKIVADTNGFAITSSTSSGGFEEARRPSSFLSNIVFATVSRSCSFMPISAAAKNPSATARSRVSRLRCRRRSTGMVFRPRLMAARRRPVVMPASRKIEAAKSRPSQGACCRTERSFQASRCRNGPAPHN